MGKPVEIEFLMRDRLTGGIVNAGKSVDALGDKVDVNNRKLRSMGDTMDSEGARIEKVSRRFMQGAVAYMSVDKGSELINRMIDIRAERQMLEKSFEVLLQSKGEAKQMLQQMIQLAVDSPLQLTPIAKAGQTLIGFGVDASKVMDVLRQLSDISMGNQQRFESLSLAYAQVQAAGRLMGQDLLQLVNAGFNPLKIMSEQTGKSMAVLKKEMEDGKISSEMVADAFTKATSAGGQFYGMTQMQAKGIQGVKSTFQDAIVTAYNKLGEANEDVIISGYKMATEVVQNYEPIIKTLGVIIATYGTYKAALIATHAIEQAQASVRYSAEIEELSKLIPQKQASINADLQAAVAKGRLSQARADQMMAIRAEIDAEMERLRQVAVATNAEYELSQVKLKSAKEEEQRARENAAFKQQELREIIAQTQAEKAASIDKLVAIESEKQSIVTLKAIKLQARKEESIAAVQELQLQRTLGEAAGKDVVAIQAKIEAKQREIAAISNKIKVAQAEEIQSSRNIVALRAERKAIDDNITSVEVEQAKTALNTAESNLNTATKVRAGAARDVLSKKAAVNVAVTKMETFENRANTAATVAGARAKNLFAIAGKKVVAVMHSMKAAFMSNPIGLILTGIVAVTSAMSLFSDTTEEAEENTVGLTRANKKAGEEFDTQAAKIKTLQGIIENGNVAYDERKRAINELKSIIPEYNGQLSQEGTLINNNTEAIKQYLVQLERQIKLKAIEEELVEAEKQASQKRLAIKKEEKKLSSQEEANNNYKPVVGASMYASAYGNTSGEQQAVQTRRNIEDLKKELVDINNDMVELKDELAATSILPGGNNNEVKTYTEQLADAADAVKRLKKEKADLEAGKGDGITDWYKAIEDKKKELDEAQKKYDTLRGVDKTTQKSVTDANRQKVEIAERKAQIEEYVRQVKQQIAIAEEEIAQAQIDAMKDGVLKEQAQIELNYKRLIRENAEREAEMVKERQKVERLQWENKHPNYKDKGEVFTPTTTKADLTPEQLQILKKYTDAANAYKEKADADLLKENLKKYATYEQDRARIAKEYDDQIALLKSKNTDGQYDGNIKKAQEEKDRMLAELDATMQASSDLWGRLFDNYSSYTNKQLQEIISNAQQVLDYVNSTKAEDIMPQFGMSAEQLKNLKANASDLSAAYGALGAKLQELNRRNPFGAMIRSSQLLKKNTVEVANAEQELAGAQASGDKQAIKDAKEKLAGLQRQRDLLKGDLKEASLAAVGYLGDVGDSLQQIGEASGDAGLASFGKALSEVSGIAEKFMSGDVIGGAISAITTGLTAIFSSRAKYRAALKQMHDDQIAFAHEYKMLMSDIRLESEQASNAFGDDAFTKAISALKELKSNYEDFIALVNKDDGVQASRQGLFGMFNQMKQEAKGITTDLQNIWIQTQHKTWFRKEKGEYLKDLYPELFKDQDGSDGFNVEAARALLSTNNQLNDEAKRQLQEVVDLYDQWKEAEDQFKEYLNSTFGEIGDSLGDSIVDAFKNGTDAMEIWGKSFNNVLEKLGKQMMQTLFFQKHFDKLQDDLTKIYEDYGDDPNEVARRSQELMGNFFQGMAGTVEEAENWYKDYADQAKKNGFDLSGGTDTNTEQQSGKAGAFQTMSQDTGTELKGLFTSVQMHVSNIDDKLDDLHAGIYRIGDKIAEVAENTKRSADRLDEVAEDIKAIKRDGIKVK